jgi:homoserine O-acetyltransferase/O-succinyltransferase
MAGTQGSVGVVKTKYFRFNELKLESGKKLHDVQIAYETYGKLNRKKDNAILVCHALSGDQHAAGKHRKNSRKNGWYDIAIGPGKTFDTRKYYIISSNVIGGCGGSTGPPSINPKTQKPYGLSFPRIAIADMVKAQKRLIDHLGIKKLFCVVGGSMGGMQTLEWCRIHPDYLEKAIVIAASARQYPMGVAFHEIGRQAILSDPEFRDGEYYGGQIPKNGLSIARQIAHITYLSQSALEKKFAKKKGKQNGKTFGTDYGIRGYLNYKGESFVRCFDANTYLYITDAIDNFDLTDGGKTRLSQALDGVKAKVLLVSFTSDWLYPPEQVKEIYCALAEAGVPTRYSKLDLPYGHDAFLIYNNTLGNLLSDFLRQKANG